MTDEKKEYEKQNFNFAFGAESTPDESKPWDDDALDRERFGARLTDFVKGVGGDSSFVVSVDGEWGSGKTFFLKRWRQQLKNDKAQAVYFNAWEDDFHSNPLVAIVGQLWRAIKGTDWKEMGKSLKQAMPAVASRTAMNFLQTQKKDWQSSAEQTVDAYLAEREKVDDFKGRLKELACAVKKTTGFPLVFIIDELDRCRPTFAIELLERVKHALNVPGVVFVFGINKTQLAKSIQSVYGDIDAEDYLRRFFDMPLVMTPADSSVYCRHLLAKCEVIKSIGQSGVHSARYGIFGQWSGSWKEAMGIYPAMVHYMNLSLREVEHSLRMLLFVLHSKEIKNKKEWRMIKEEGWAVVCLIFLRIKFPDLYRQFTRGDCASVVVIDKMHECFPTDMESEPTPDGRDIRRCLDAIEAEFYRFAMPRDREVIENSILACSQGKSNPGHLAKRTIAQGGDHARHIRNFMSEGVEPYHCAWLDQKEIAGMLDLVDGHRN